MIVIVDPLEIEMYHFMSPEIQFYASFGRIPLVAPMTVLLIRVVGPVLRRALSIHYRSQAHSLTRIQCRKHLVLVPKRKISALKGPATQARR
jgi:hypothetical protein